MPKSNKKKSPKKAVKKNTARDMSVPEIGTEDSSINIRKIENGLLVRVSKNTKKKYTTKEFYAKTEAEAKTIVSKAL